MTGISDCIPDNPEESSYGKPSRASSRRIIHADICRDAVRTGTDRFRCSLAYDATAGHASARTHVDEIIRRSRLHQDHVRLTTTVAPEATNESNTRSNTSTSNGV